VGLAGTQIEYADRGVAGPVERGKEGFTEACVQHRVQQIFDVDASASASLPPMNAQGRRQDRSAGLRNRGQGLVVSHVEGCMEPGVRMEVQPLV
jgi:hypothetical protein